MTHDRKTYPSDVTDDEWSLVVPYLTLMCEDAPQRTHSLRELFNDLRYVIRYGIAWRAMPHDLPPGQRCISSPSAGSRLDALRRWLMIFGPCFGWLRVARPNPRPRLSTAGPCDPRQRAARARDTTVPNASAARSSHGGSDDAVAIIRDPSECSAFRRLVQLHIGPVRGRLSVFFSMCTIDP
jgi:transposase